MKKMCYLAASGFFCALRKEILIMSNTCINEFGVTCCKSVLFCSTVLAAALAVNAAFPVEKNIQEGANAETSASFQFSDENTAHFEQLFDEAGPLVNSSAKADNGLALYREPSSRPAVEWFYLHVTGNRETATAILSEADRNDVSPSLAFALAYVESRYKVTAVNKNTNASIDRGLFQLNDRSFPSLTEDDFFNPAISAKHGMAHLRYCMNIAGNEIAALCMYNAGTVRVRSNNTPQMTLNYVGKILAYREKIEKLFHEEVLAYYEAGPLTGVTVARLGSQRR